MSTSACHRSRPSKPVESRTLVTRSPTARSAESDPVEIGTGGAPPGTATTAPGWCGAKCRPWEAATMSRYTGPPMTLGNAAEHKVRLIVWCLDCQHQIQPDPAELAKRYGVGMSVPGLARAARLREVRRAAHRYGGDRDRAPLNIIAN